MANIWNILKTFRPRKTILSDDFNSLQYSLAAGFNKIGTAPPDGHLGVSSPFHCGDPVGAQDAVTKSWHEVNTAAVVGLLIGDAVDAAAASAAAAEASAEAADLIREDTDLLWQRNAIFFSFFYGTS